MARPRKNSANSVIPDQPLGSLYDYLAKIILLGPSGSGKSCLLHRFVKSEWRILSSQTIGVEFASKIVKIGTGANRRRVKLQLWDTAGTERFRSVSRSYYRGAAGAILVYDIASLATFNALPTFLMDARALGSPNLSVILAGNKMDLAESTPAIPPDSMISPSSASSRQTAFPHSIAPSLRSHASSVLGGPKFTATAAEGREVTPDIASRWASRSTIPVTLEVSALSGENVDELFNKLARMILTKIELGEIDPGDPQSGIQYGDTAGWDGESVRSGLTLEDDTLRRRKGNRSLIGDWDRNLASFTGHRQHGSRRCC